MTLFKKIKIFLLIRSLNIGGAERQVVALANRLPKDVFDVSLGVFYGDSREQKYTLDPHVNVIWLGKKGRWDLPRFLTRLVRSIGIAGPDILYSFLPEANLAALMAGPFAGNPKVIWGIRASGLEYSHYDWLPRASGWLISKLWPLSSGVISNSNAGLRSHRIENRKNLPARVIPNGIDTDRFRPDSNLRKEMRDSLGIRDGQRLIGIVARLDPMKDHETFFKAAASLMKKAKQEIKLVCVGGGSEDYTRYLKQVASNLGIADEVIWYGIGKNMPKIYNGIDLLCSSSAFGEGFSNAIGEAMACGIPCVATDVGDSARIIADTGIIVPPMQPGRLASALEKALYGLDQDEASFKQRARSRIVRHYSMDRMVRATSEVFFTLVSQ